MISLPTILCHDIFYIYHFAKKKKMYLPFFFSAGAGTQHLVHTRLVLCHGAVLPAPIPIIFNSYMSVSATFCPPILYSTFCSTAVVCCLPSPHQSFLTSCPRAIELQQPT